MQEHGGVDLPTDDIVERLLDGVIARLHRKIPWRPGARELLADLNEAGVPCALVTMSWRRFVDPVMAALPPRSFVAAITGDEVPLGSGKPAPDPYLFGAEACGVHPADCLAIEDSPTGVRSAIAAGCRVIGVPNVRALAREPGLTIVESLDDIRLDDLARIMSAPIEPAPRSLRDRSRTGTHPAAARCSSHCWCSPWCGSRPVATTGRNRSPCHPARSRSMCGRRTGRSATRCPKPNCGSRTFGRPHRSGTRARGVDEIVVDENASTELTDRFLEAISDAPALARAVDRRPDAGRWDGGDPRGPDDPAAAHRHDHGVRRRDLDVDGIDLDYEQFAFADGSASWAATRPNWVAFVTELADELHADDRTLTVSIPPVWGLPADVIEAATAADGAAGDDERRR